MDQVEQKAKGECDYETVNYVNDYNEATKISKTCRRFQLTFFCGALAITGNAEHQRRHCVFLYRIAEDKYLPSTVEVRDWFETILHPIRITLFIKKHND